MCGIVGLIARHGTLPFYAESLFTNLVMMDTIRGPDGTGVFGITSSGHVDSQKGNTDGYVFTRSKQYQDFKARIRDYRIVVGHNRKATVGATSAENAHPFRERHIIMVHNGTLRGTTGLKNTEVDSHAICHALADHDPVQALEKINGAYALVWYDASDKTLNLARNSERPLSLLEYPVGWCIASEAGLPAWLNNRENRKVEKIMMVPEKKILTFKLDALEKGFFEIPYEEYKTWKAPTYSSFPHHVTREEPKLPAHTFRSPTDGRVINIQSAKTSSSNPKLKAGEEVTFELEDEKVENGAEVLLGHPVFDGEKDENIIIRTVLPKGDDPMRYFGLGKEHQRNFNNKLWKAKIQHVRQMGGALVLFVHQMEPYLIVVDAQGETNEKNEVTKVLDEGCSRCQQKVSIDDVHKAIVRKKANGSWRIVCPSCLNKSISEAQERNPQLSLRAH